HPGGELVAPRGTEAGTTGRERHAHAVHRAHRVEVRRHRETHVVGQLARCADVEHEEGAARGERGTHLAQHAGRIGLIVDRVKGGDEVERGGYLELRDVLHD